MSTKQIRTTNADARYYVQRRMPFKGSNTYGFWDTTIHDEEIFIVESYGAHWPLFVYEAGHWYENADKASKTTSKHKGQLHPHCETERYGVEDMKAIAALGIAGLMQRKLSRTA